MLVTAPQVQARQQMPTAINLADGHGTVECTNKDPYGLIAKNSAKDIAVPRDYLPAALELPALTPCRIIAWCERMAWKDGDTGPAFILIMAQVGKAFAMRPAVLAPLLKDKQAAASLAADSDDELGVAPHPCDADVVSEGEEAGEEAEEGEEEGGDDGGVTEGAAAIANQPWCGFAAAAIKERAAQLHGTTTTARAKNYVHVECAGGKNKRYKPGSQPRGWGATAGDFNKAFTDTVPKGARERDPLAGLKLKEKKGELH